MVKCSLGTMAGEVSNKHPIARNKKANLSILNVFAIIISFYLGYKN